jgi:hypothetical protein
MTPSSARRYARVNWRNALLTCIERYNASRGFFETQGIQLTPWATAETAPHQPFENVLMRTTPGLVILPADVNEVVEAYRSTLKLRREPGVLIFLRQPFSTLDRTRYGRHQRWRTAPGIWPRDPPGILEAILIASGSEVSLAVNADGIRSRVVSMRSWDVCDHQSQDCQDPVLPPSVKVAHRGRGGINFRMGRYVGDSGRMMGMKPSERRRRSKTLEGLRLRARTCDRDLGRGLGPFVSGDGPADGDRIIKQWNNG